MFNEHITISFKFLFLLSADIAFCVHHAHELNERVEVVKTK